jgi:hypothetical protein
MVILLLAYSFVIGGKDWVYSSINPNSSENYNGGITINTNVDTRLVSNKERLLSNNFIFP